MNESPVISTKYTFDRVVRLILTLGIGWLLLVLLRQVADVVWPLFAALMLAYLLDPWVSAIQARLQNRLLAVLAVFSLIGVAMLLLLAVLGPILIAETEASVQIVQSLGEENSPLRQWLTEWSAYLPETSLVSFDVKNLLQTQQNLQTALLDGLQWLVPQLGGVFSGAWSLVGLGFQLFMVGIYLVFLLIDFKHFAHRWSAYVPDAYRQEVVFFVDSFNNALGLYFRGQFLVASTVGILFAFGFWCIGLRAGILLGLLMGVLNMVPYLQIVGMLPAAFLALVTALEHQSAFGLVFGATLAVITAVQLLQDTFIAPKIMGDQTGLRPVLILFSVFFWGKLLGFLGVLLAIPLTVIGVAYWHRLLGYAPRTRAAPRPAM